MQVKRSGGKTLDVLSWASLLVRGPTQLSNFVLFLVVKSVVKSYGLVQAWRKISKVLSWSFQALASGKWPMTDWNDQDFEEDSIDFKNRGLELANGYSDIIFTLRSDLEFLSGHFHLNHTGSNSPCCLCKCNRSMDSRPWTDCRKAAAWRPSGWGKQEWAFCSSEMFFFCQVFVWALLDSFFVASLPKTC